VFIFIGKIKKIIEIGGERLQEYHLRDIRKERKIKSKKIKKMN